MKKIILTLLVMSEAAFGAYKLKGLSDVTVTSAGTRVQLTSSNILTPSVCIEAKSTNAGKVYVGDSNVTSSLGIELQAGQSICFDGGRVPGFDMIDLSTIYLDASTSTQVAKITYFVYSN